MFTILMKGYNMEIVTEVTNRRAGKLLKALLRAEKRISPQGFIRLVAGGVWKPATQDNKVDFVVNIDSYGVPNAIRG